MGSAIAASLATRGIRVLTCLDGRSERSRQLAADNAMEDMDSLESLVGTADIFLSIMPPAAALDFANTVLPLIGKADNDCLFVDCNAVSPMTVLNIASVAAEYEVRFQDAGIIGAAPRSDRIPVRFYTSGPWNDEIAGLATELIDVKPIGVEIGQASGIKMVYASLTKGTHALRAAALMAGEELGVGEEIRSEWQYSLPDVFTAMEKRIPNLAADSGRWTGEMREIAATYASLGITPAFHHGAEWIYELLAGTSLAGESRDEAKNKDRSLAETLQHFTQALKK